MGKLLNKDPPSRLFTDEKVTFSTLKAYFLN